MNGPGPAPELAVNVRVAADRNTLMQRVGRRLAGANDLPLKLLAVSILVGALAGLAGVLYHHLTDLLQAWALGSTLEPVAALGQITWWWKLALPAVGGLLVAPIVYRWVPETRGTGTPEVMKAVVADQGRIRGRVAPSKLIASSLTVASGGSVGREGPIIHIGAALGSKASQLLGWSSASAINLCAAGAAAGIAAMFNAPIAGAFFALEVIVKNFAASSFAPIVLASVTATAVSRAFLGDFPAFTVSTYSLVSGWEMILYLGLGIVAALVGVLFSVTLDASLSFFNRWAVPDLLKPVIGGLGVGACLFLAPAVYGTGFDTISDILAGGVDPLLLLVLLPVKLLATAFTTGSGGSGGVFSPTLFLGAIVGALFGVAANFILPGSSGPIGAYALVGMGAMLAGVTHAPIASILMLFEITGDYEIILPLMVACVTGSILARGILPKSFYEFKLERLGVRTDIGREESLMRSFRVEDVMRPGGRTVQPNKRLPKLITEFLASRVNERYVVSEEGHYEGFISLHDIKEILGEEGLEDLVVAEDIAHRDVPEVSPHLSLSDCMQRFVESGIDRLPVVSEATGHFLGTISEHDVIGLYNREILRKDFLGTIDFQDDSQERQSLIQLPSDYTVSAVGIPEWLVGKTLAEAQLRARFHLTVVSIQDPDTPGRDEVPNPERPLQAGVHLVLVGLATDIEAFEHSRPPSLED